MNVIEFDDIAAGWRRSERALSIDPANNTLLLSAIQCLQNVGAKFDERIYVLEDGDRAIGAAVRVDTRTLFLPIIDEATAEALGRHLRKRDAALSGAVGPRDVVERFTIAYLRGSAKTPKVHVRLMLYRLSETFRLAPNYGRAHGNARVATLDDLPLCVEWQMKFEDEIGALKTPTPVEERVRRMIDASRLVLWESEYGEVVSLAGGATLPASSARIGPVYTPPTHRGQGYAQAVTAAASLHVQRDQPRTTFLFTDAKNPASNIAYQRVGYEHIADHLHLNYIDS